MITEAIRNQLHRFATTVWGNSQAVLEHDPSGFDYIDVEQFRLGLQALFGSSAISKILVRDEYRTALQELQKDTYAPGAYVTGQPGIGKTLFLVYLLVELLGQCCKVVVHDTDGQFYAIFADNAVDFRLLTDQDPLDPDDSQPDRRIWALSDSSTGAIENEYRQSARLAVAKCQAMISSIQLKNISEDTMTQFYFCRPLRFAKPSIDHSLPCVVVPTPTICHFLAEALQKPNDSNRLEFFYNLNVRRETRQAARYIYKSWLHCFLSTGRSIHFHWIHSHGVFFERSTTTLISARLDELKDVETLPYYWVAPPKFPGIDGALIHEDAIFAVQVIPRAKDKSVEEGLEKLHNNLPPDLKDLPWHLVFVGNNQWSIERVANEWAGKISLPKSHWQKRVTVGWSPVDPVEEGITYRITCDEEDLMEVEDEDE